MRSELVVSLSVLLENTAIQAVETSTVVPAKSDSDVMFCLQSLQELIINRSLVY